MIGTPLPTKSWFRKTRFFWGLGLMLIAVLALGAGITSQHLAHATTYDVCSSCTYTSIQTAINAASAGDTVTVGPGTYTETLTINKALTLQGANVGIDGTSASRGTESIIDANGAATPTIMVNASGADVTIDGFKITGSHKEGLTAPSVGTLTVQNNIFTENYNGIFEMSGTDLIIQHNLIRDNTTHQTGSYSCFGGHPYCNGIFAGGNYTNISILYNTIDETYTSPADIITNFQRALSISPSAPATATAHIEHNTFIGAATIGHMTGDFANNAFTGGLFGLRIVGSLATFSVDHNTFSGLLSNAVITQKSYGSTNTDLTISDNTVNQDVSLLYSGEVVDGADVASFDLGYIGGTTTVASNTITYTGTYNGQGSPAVTAVHAIRLRSTAGGTIAITGNTLNGGGVGGTGTNGIQIDNGAPAPTIENNIIRDFDDGVFDDSAQTYATVGGNCISGNTTYGYEASDGAVTAHGNWWGSALGPGAGIGYGNPVTTSTVDASSFLTTAPHSACAGPVASSVTSPANPLATQATYAVTANLSTTTTSGGAVTMAYYTLDGGSPKTMSTTSGTFGTSNTVQVTSGTLSAFSSPGTHTVCVFGLDAYGQTGSSTCFTLTVSTTAGRSGNGGSSSTPQTAQAPSGSGSTASTGSTNAPKSTDQPKTVAGNATQPTNGAPIALIILLILLAFGLIGGGAVLVARTRKTNR